MENVIGQQISNHLEFLGYTIKYNSKEASCKFEATIATWTTPNLGLKIDKDDFVFIECSYGRWNSEIWNSLEFHNLIQKINQSSLFSRWYPTKKSDGSGVVVEIETWAFGYEKNSFGRTITSFIDDVRKNIPSFYDNFDTFRIK